MSANRASSAAASVHWWMKPRSSAAARKAERCFGDMAASSSTNLTAALGLMSGTSLDGIDVAAIETDGERQVAIGPALTVPYPADFRERLRSVLGGEGTVAGIERELTELHADAVAEFRRRYPDAAFELIGFHGHTILHRPAERRTWQIGNGALLARLTGVDVIGDFRSADVAVGAALPRRAGRRPGQAAGGAQPRRGRECDVDR